MWEEKATVLTERAVGEAPWTPLDPLAERSDPARGQGGAHTAGVSLYVILLVLCCSCQIDLACAGWMTYFAGKTRTQPKPNATFTQV